MTTHEYEWVPIDKDNFDAWAAAMLEQSELEENLYYEQALTGDDERADEHLWEQSLYLLAVEFHMQRLQRMRIMLAGVF